VGEWITCESCLCELREHNYRVHLKRCRKVMAMLAAHEDAA
jgi:hypothetical protein